MESPRQNISFSVLVHISGIFSLRFSASVFRAVQPFCVINNVTVVTFNIHFHLCSVNGISVFLVMWCEPRPLSFYSHSALKQQGAYIQLLVKTALAANWMTHLMADMWLYWWCGYTMPFLNISGFFLFKFALRLHEPFRFSGCVNATRGTVVKKKPADCS